MDNVTLTCICVGLAGAAVLALDAWINKQEITNQRADAAKRTDQALYNEHQTLALNPEARARHWEEQARLAELAGRHEAADTAYEMAWVARQGHES